MPLRVLLADESSTIKKVFQLTLQDYAVEVRSVNVGVDVKMVAQQFKPDIIFADILLQQKSGYDVSAELKNEAEFLKTPVVLMWSGFMDIDEDKFLASKADAKLEKPFEVEKLRGLVNQFVPKTKSQNIANFLTFPKLPDFKESAQRPPPPISVPSAKELLTTEQSQKNSEWDMEQFASIDEYTPDNSEQFASVNLTDKMPQRDIPKQHADADLIKDDPEDNSGWVQNQIEDFRLNIPVDDNSNADDDELLVENLIDDNALASHIEQQVPRSSAAASEELEIATPTPSFVPQQLSEEQLTKIISEQSKEIIEKVVWRVVPEIATQIIERELKRLLDEKSL